MSAMSEPTSGRGALMAGGLAALLASTCCLGPLVLVTLGVSGAWIGNLTALEPYRPVFLGAALVAMFLAYRRIFKQALNEVQGVSRTEVSYEKKQAVVSFDDAKTNVRALTKATADAGYPSTAKQ